MAAGTQYWRYKTAPTEFDVEVGARLRELRVERGLTLAQLGDAVDLTKQQISLFEHGKNRMCVEVLAAICVTLRVSADTLLGLATPFDSPPDQPPAPPPLM